MVVPEMQIKLKQCFGRAVHAETDTCVVDILDERAVPDHRYFEAMLSTLPEMQATNSLSLFYFLRCAIMLNLFLNTYRAENEKQRAKLVKNDSEQIRGRIEIYCHLR